MGGCWFAKFTVTYFLSTNSVWPSVWCSLRQLSISPNRAVKSLRCEAASLCRPFQMSVLQLPRPRLAPDARQLRSDKLQALKSELAVILDRLRECCLPTFVKFKWPKEEDL